MSLTPGKQNEGRLRAFLAGVAFPDWDSLAVEECEPCAAGHSKENLRVDLSGTRNGQGVNRSVVLRFAPTPGALDVDMVPLRREYELLDVLGETSVPTPPVHGYCEDETIWGKEFFVMDFVEGDVPDYRNVHTRSYLQDESERARLTEEFLRTLAELQTVDVTRSPLPEVLDVESFDGEYSRRRVEYYDSIIRRHSDAWTPHPVLTDTRNWLLEHAPSCEDPVLVHGDFRVGNFVWRDRSIRAFLDWELASVGDPLEDLGYACHPIQRERNPELMGMLAPREEFLGRYEEFTGRTVDEQRLQYFIVLALYFHSATVIIGLDNLLERGVCADFRMSGLYRKLNQVTRHLTTELERAV